MKTRKLFFLLFCLSVGVTGAWAQLTVTGDQVSADSQQDATKTYIPQNAVDGKLTTRWSSAGDLRTNPPKWIEIDLGGNYVLDSIGIVWLNTSGTKRAYRYEVLLYDALRENVVQGVNRLTNTQQSTGTALTLGSGVLGDNFAAGKNTGRYVRVSVTGASATAVVNASLFEIELFGWGVKSSLTDINWKEKSILLSGETPFTKADFVNSLDFYGEQITSCNIMRGGTTLSDGDNVEAGDKLVVISKYKNTTEIGFTEPDYTGCTMLKNLSLPACDGIGDYAFFACSDLEQLSFPYSNPPVYGKKAFANPSNVTIELDNQDNDIVATWRNIAEWDAFVWKSVSTAIETVEVTEWRIETQGNNLLVSGLAPNVPVRFVTSLGVQYRFMPSSDGRLDIVLPAGFYIINQQNRSEKIIISK